MVTLSSHTGQDYGMYQSQPALDFLLGKAKCDCRSSLAAVPFIKLGPAIICELLLFSWIIFLTTKKCYAQNQCLLISPKAIENELKN
jgi:hypothetical protein